MLSIYFILPNYDEITTPSRVLVVNQRDEMIVVSYEMCQSNIRM